MKKITKDWLDSAKGDLFLIEKIIYDHHLTHLAAFHAQQAIEKSMKAIIEEFELGFIKTHNLENLYHIVKTKWVTNIDLSQFILLDQLYIDARYPGEMGLLPEGKPSVKESMKFQQLAVYCFENASYVCGGEQSATKSI